MMVKWEINSCEGGLGTVIIYAISGDIWIFWRYTPGRSKAAETIILLASTARVLNINIRRRLRNPFVSHCCHRKPWGCRGVVQQRSEKGGIL